MLGGEERVDLTGPGTALDSFHCPIWSLNTDCVSGNVSSLCGMCQNEADRTPSPRVSQTLVGEMYQNTNYASQNLESVLKIKVQMKYGGSEIVGI